MNQQHITGLVTYDLKIGEFEPEFVSKMNLYLGVADDTLKGDYDNPSVGLILCKSNNKIIAEYALRDSSKPIGIAEYKIAQMLPDDIKGELPSIAEIEQRMDEELMDKHNPVDVRLQTIKEKLKGIKGEPIQTTITDEILHKLYHDSLNPLYKELIEKLSVFDDDFHIKKINWNNNGNQVFSLDQLKKFWDEGENFKSLKELIFNYDFEGFKKAGTENYNAYLELRLITDKYWYGFILIGYNNQRPFLKKQYHQKITPDDRKMITDLIMNKVMDDIDWIVEKVNNTKN